GAVDAPPGVPGRERLPFALAEVPAEVVHRTCLRLDGEGGELLGEDDGDAPGGEELARVGGEAVDERQALVDGPDRAANPLVNGLDGEPPGPERGEGLCLLEGREVLPGAVRDELLLDDLLVAEDDDLARHPAEAAEARRVVAALPVHDLEAALGPAPHPEGVADAGDRLAPRVRFDGVEDAGDEGDELVVVVADGD